MTERDPALEAFDALIGTWDTEATHPQFEGVVTGSVTYEWLEGGHFVVQRSHNDHELFPDGICVIGAPEDGVLRIWRHAPGFDQRMVATLGRDSFEGVYQLARTPGDWQDDLRVTFRRRS